MREWFKARNSWGAALETLSDAEAGRLAKAMFAYTMRGEQRELSGAERAIFAIILMTLRQDEQAAAEISEKRAVAGSAGGKQTQANASKCKQLQANACNKNSEKETDTEKETEVKETTPNGVEKKSAVRFTAPTVEEVRAYCLERRNGVDPVRFCDFYAANGWKQGRGKPIVDWRACVRTWERDGPRNVNGQPSSSKSKYDQVKKN